MLAKMATEQWKTAFKEIHGKTPTKSDYSMAPLRIRDEIHAEQLANPAAKPTVKSPPVRSFGVRLKRPAADDQWSPLKKMPAKRVKPTVENDTPAAQRPVLRSTLFNVTMENSILSPKKQVTFSPMKAAVQLIPSVKSPSRLAQQSPSKRKLTNASPYRSLFDTPEKGETSILSAVISSQGSTTTPKSPRTPIRSPRKPIHRASTLKNKNIASLLLPTPEKKILEEVYEPYETDEMAQTSSKNKPDSPCADVLDPETGKVVPKPYIRPLFKSSPRRKKDGENFVRINMKKKSFVRGKVSAESKRKLRKKQMWRKRY